VAPGVSSVDGGSGRMLMMSAPSAWTSTQQRQDTQAQADAVSMDV
jgi:hypothetical protein